MKKIDLLANLYIKNLNIIPQNLLKQNASQIGFLYYKP